MGAGDCHEVSIKYFTNVDFTDKRLRGEGVPLAGSQKMRDARVDESIVLVQLEREMFSEYWGHHSVVLFKKESGFFDEDMVLDLSNGARLTNEGKPLIEPKEKMWEEWNVQVDGDGMYFEYNYVETIQKIMETLTYEPFELKRSRWMDEGHTEYMRDYFIPNFQPTTQKLMEESDREKTKGVKQNV